MRTPWSASVLVLALLLLTQTSPCSSATTTSQTVVPPSISQSVQQEETASSSLNNETADLISSAATNNSSYFNDDTLPEWRKELPVELRNKTKTLQRIIVPGTNGCRVEVYLLGTAHVSIDSSRDVRRLLETVDPSVLFLELCDQRIPMMLSPPPSPPANTTANQEVIMTPEHKPKRAAAGLWGRIRHRSKKSTPSPPRSRSMYGMAAGLLTNMQQDYAESLGVELGGEFRVAYNYWDEQRQHKPIHMILGDRPLYLTLTRAWEGLGIWGKIKLMVSLLVSSFQKPDPAELKEWMQKILADDTGDLLTESIAELAQHFPTLEKVIIQERDAYMACKLYQTCRQLLSQEYPRQTMPQVQRLVAIVGAGHVQGMCQLLTQGNGKTPEETLAPLVDIKKSISMEDRRVLIFDVLEVNHEQLKALAQELDASSNPP